MEARYVNLIADIFTGAFIFTESNMQKWDKLLDFRCFIFDSSHPQ